MNRCFTIVQQVLHVHGARLPGLALCVAVLVGLALAFRGQVQLGASTPQKVTCSMKALWNLQQAYASRHGRFFGQDDLSIDLDFIPDGRVPKSDTNETAAASVQPPPHPSPATDNVLTALELGGLGTPSLALSDDGKAWALLLERPEPPHYLTFGADYLIIFEISQLPKEPIPTAPPDPIPASWSLVDQSFPVTRWAPRE